MNKAVGTLALLCLIGRGDGARALEVTTDVSANERGAESGAADTEVQGRLCFAEQRECRPTRGVRLEVPPMERSRRYVWLADDYSTVIAGELLTRAAVINLDPKETSLRTISVQVRGNADRGWPADAEFTISESRNKEWKWAVPAETTGRKLNVHLPPGNYVLFINAPRHYRLARRLPADGNLVLDAIELKPLPTIRGRVIGVEEGRVTPVSGAQILSADGPVVGTADEQGIFRAELSEPVAKEVIVVSPGLGAQVIKLEQLGAETDLGDVRLESGAALTLQIARPHELREQALRVRLLRHDELLKHSQVARSELPVGDEQLRFADLAPGPYYVVLEGNDPLERMLVPVEIGRQDVTAEIVLRPFRLNGRVVVGEEPLRQGEVEVAPLGAGQTVWRARLKIHDDGSFGGLLWQTGRLTAFVHGHGSGGILHDESPELGSDPSVWTLSFKPRVIHGRVLDAETNAAAEGVRFDLKVTRSGGGSRSSVSVAPDGEYRIQAWEDGTYDLIVSARDLLPLTKTLRLGETDGSRRVDLALDRGSNVRLEFFWGSGPKVLSPNIYEGVSRDGHNPERLHRTDASGILELTLRPDASRLIYVLPAEGSFAAVRVTARTSSGTDPVRVEIPLVSGTLQVRLKDVEPKTREALIMMRYNGEWIPHAVTTRLRKKTGDGVVEFLAMPAGAYELWAVSPAERQSAPNVPPSHAPVRVGVAVAETYVEVPVVRLP